MYSQNNEDEIVAKFFADAKFGECNLLDVGANDGKTFSNSLYLIEQGWSGVLLEPSPKAFALLEEQHHGNENVKLINVGIALFNGEQTFYESGGYKGGDDVALYSSLDSEEIERWGDTVPFEEVVADFITWNEFRLSRKNEKYQFISIDTEGLDLPILQMIDLDEVECKCLCIEWNNVHTNKIKILNHITPLGFRLLHENMENLILVR
jgi:FkbM family methyltransferase